MHPGTCTSKTDCYVVVVFCRESIDTDVVLHSTFILIKHRVIPMDLLLVEQPSARLFSFLSVNWGLLADIDYESEKYRAIGEARFTLQAIKRIFGEINVVLLPSIHLCLLE